MGVQAPRKRAEKAQNFGPRMTADNTESTCFKSVQVAWLVDSKAAASALSHDVRLTPRPISQQESEDLAGQTETHHWRSTEEWKVKFGTGWHQEAFDRGLLSEMETSWATFGRREEVKTQHWFRTACQLKRSTR